MVDERIGPMYEEMLAGKISDWGGMTDYSHLPSSWKRFDLEYFSEDKTLYDFQRQALENFLQFFHAFNNVLENSEGFEEAKKKLFGSAPKKEIIQNHPKDFRVQVNRGKAREISQFLRERYSINERSRYGTSYKEIDFWNFMNRMGFWIATGGGKTLVLVKLVEILDKLQREGEIPERELLILSARPDLKEQIEEHIQEYNKFHERKIRVWDLKEDYADVKGGGRIASKEDINVFTYRSDLISDETKETEISFEDFENDGKWYLLLDEAHKGESDDSKRQLYFSMLTRKGFLFNFSATFTHPWDILTTVFEHNLISFTEEGFGKKIYLSEEDFRGLSKREEEDISDSEKRKMVLKTLLILAATKKARKQVEFDYHDPLWVCFANSVNVKSSDLELVVSELERVAQTPREKVFEEAKNELVEELSRNSEYETTEKEEVDVNLERISSLSKRDVLEEVFNADTHGAMEKVYSPDNRKELMFKLKTASEPFALVRIGDVVPWVRDKFPEHPVEERVTGFGSYFKKLDDEGSPINLLLGSRSFYEGTDTNRPNVMVYDYIGIGAAQKFVLQSLGRGMRIEPKEGYRKRLRFIPDEKISDLDDKTLKDVNFLESLFVFGTSMDNLEDILKAIDTLRKKERPVENIDINPETEGKPLLIPVFRKTSADLSELSPFKSDKELIENYLDWIGDERILLAEFPFLSISKIKKVKEALREEEFEFEEIENPREALRILASDVTSEIEEYDGMKKVEDRIIHFKRINIRPETEEDFNKIIEAIDSVKEAEDPEKLKAEIKRRHEEGEITLNELMEMTEKLSEKDLLKKELREYDLQIRKELSTHYYLPYITSENEKQSYLSHIIDTPSEVEFLEDLTEYLQNNNGNSPNDYEWWYFSKLDQTVDEVYIPYDKGHEKNIPFHPDFVFWLKRDSRLHILFVEPTSKEYSRFLDRIDAYINYFEENGEVKTFEEQGLEVEVSLGLYTEDKSDVSGEKYVNYWYDSIDSLFSTIE